MKTKKTDHLVMGEASAPAYGTGEAAMVRTQIYLTKTEHEYVQQEASRMGKPMAALIRDWIDEKMEVPEDAWLNNPLLQPPAGPYDGPEDMAVNHDHHLYGGPKKHEKIKGKWVAQPPLP